MLITDKNAFAPYRDEARVWQGIPGIEVTGRGRIFIVFYSGGVREQYGNYVVLQASRDGEHFETIAVAAPEVEGRCYDACVWIDPVGRLWFVWAQQPEHAVFAAVCDDPDAESLTWGEEFRIGSGLMLNKPTVLRDGAWLLPVAVWDHGISVVSETEDPERGSFVYSTADQGRTFRKLGGADVPDRHFDEHMVLERQDGSLLMLVRTFYGIGKSESFDGGRTWTKGVDSGIPGPDSRFFLRRLRSGRVLLVNHVNFEGRNNLTALLSEDDCATWKYSLLLDGRNDVSYPDGVEAEDGYLYITYDRERGAFKNSLEEAQAAAREILYAKITEEDIIRGETGPGSFLVKVASKLGTYDAELGDPFR